MDHNLYVSLASRASDLVEAGEHREALEVLAQLVNSDLPDFDRGISWLNIATVHDQMGNHKEALESYSSALECEGRTTAYFIAQQYAAYLAHLGMYKNSITAYQELLERRDIKPEDRNHFLANVQTLEKLADK